MNINRQLLPEPVFFRSAILLHRRSSREPGLEGSGSTPLRRARADVSLAFWPRSLLGRQAPKSPRATPPGGCTHLGDRLRSGLEAFAEARAPPAQQRRKSRRPSHYSRSAGARATAVPTRDRGAPPTVRRSAAPAGVKLVAANQLPHVRAHEEVVLATVKPGCLSKIEYDFFQEVKQHGGSVKLRKTVQFVHLSSGTGQPYAQSAFGFFSPNFQSQRYPNENWGHFQGGNRRSSTYNCSGPTKAMVIVGRRGIHKALQDFMYQCRRDHNHPSGHPWPWVHVSKGDVPANDRNGTFLSLAVC